MKAEAPDSLKTAQAAMDKYEPGTWLTDYNLALRLSKESGKPVLINFTGSDWCPWCFRLRDEVFSQDAF
ncbi:MAG: thioredoxin family protein, partial [Candidatus Syntrophosphaera sp.]|nr:thioredoxin family protein [Candidatus Syntrophosphaera sp.]